jgi:hypothetical protein
MPIHYRVQTRTLKFDALFSGGTHSDIQKSADSHFDVNTLLA